MNIETSADFLVNFDVKINCHKTIEQRTSHLIVPNRFKKRFFIYQYQYKKETKKPPIRNEGKKYRWEIF